jgi:alkylhydroperoxidase family enzyme
VAFLAVYVREAHPTDGWRMPSNDRVGVAVPQPTTHEERTGVAAKCCEVLKTSMPMVVDEIDDRVGHAYSGMPDRLYVIGRDGRVAYKSGRGPFGFIPGEMEQGLVMHLLDTPAAPRKEGRLPALNDEDAWKRLPALDKEASKLQGQPLPVWARTLVDALPRTTAAMLELDHRHRAASPLDPKLRGRMRWVAAHANACPYGEAYALADLERAGLTTAEREALVKGEHGKLTEGERLALAFAAKMTVAANTVTDEEVKRLRQLYGDAPVVAMVQLLGYANFQDRLLPTLGVGVEPDGPRPPLAVKFARSGTRPPVPARVPPRGEPAAAPVVAVRDPDWTKLDFGVLRKEMEAQKAREGRIPVPTWEEVKQKYPPGAPLPPRPVGIRWSLVCMGYQPELTLGWSACTRAFGEEAAQDRVFEESLFWVVTRSLQCFY